MRQWRACAIVILIAAYVCPCRAQDFRSADHSPRIARVWHYISTHKELLASDAIIVSAWAADAASTVNVEHNCPNCVETNPIVGKHPSEHAVWTYGIAVSGGMVAVNHLIWRYAPDPILRHMIWMNSGPLAFEEFYNVQGNVQAARSESVHRHMAIPLNTVNLRNNNLFWYRRTFVTSNPLHISQSQAAFRP